MQLITLVRSFVRTHRRVISGPLAKAFLRLYGIQYGTGLYMNSFPVCRRVKGAQIKLGSNVTIFNTVRENLAGTAHRTILAAERSGARLLVGNGVGISGAALNCWNSITIEDNVNIGVGVRIYDSDFHPIGAMARRNHDDSKVKTAPVRICEDVWLGAESMILKGVTVGARSIVAARAVVVKDVPEDCIVAGVPARIVARLDQSAL